MVTAAAVTTAWVIQLLTFTGSHQGYLTDAAGKVQKFPDENACQNTLRANHLDAFNPFRWHGKCVEAPVLD